MKCSKGHEFNCPLISAFNESPQNQAIWSTAGTAAPAITTTWSTATIVPSIKVYVSCPVCGAEVPK